MRLPPIGWPTAYRYDIRARPLIIFFSLPLATDYRSRSVGLFYVRKNRPTCGTGMLGTGTRKNNTGTGRLPVLTNLAEDPVYWFDANLSLF